MDNHAATSPTVVPFDTAGDIIRSHLPSPATENISIEQASGRYLATDVHARIDVPPFNRSMMDGYALSADDILAGTTVFDPLEITVPAGESPPVDIPRGRAVRVMTGAPVPAGAGAVARFEWCVGLPDGRIEVRRYPEMGESVQKQGEDGHTGQKLQTAGTRLTMSHLAVLQSFGVETVSAVRQPRVTLLVTGSELVTHPSIPLKPGQIYATNHLLLQGAFEADSLALRATEFVPDDEQRLTNVLQDAVSSSDYVFITGGVSVGDYDYTPRAMQAVCRGELLLRKVLMRPGSPLAMGQADNGCTIFGLSGNPAACFVQYAALVRPALRAALGHPEPAFPLTGELVHDMALKPIKPTRIHRGIVRVENGRLAVDCNVAQSSGVISSFLATNALIRLDDSSYQTGDKVPLQWLN